MRPTPSSLPKHRRVFESLLRQIRLGEVPPGGRLPSEAALVRQFGASRITVARALRDLQQAGLVERRVGSGTFVRHRRAPEATTRTFGVLMPQLGEVEIFDRVCQGLTEAPESQPHALLWGSVGGGGPDREVQARQLARQYVERRVDGVFFAPLEHLPDQVAVNRRIAQLFDEAGIPVVLVDRPIERYPRRSRYDLVGLDNRRAGALMTEHLIDAGCRRLLFAGLPDAAATVDAREAGFREAASRPRADGVPAFEIYRGDPEDLARLRTLLDAFAPDGIVCASDRTAARLMHALLGFGLGIPRDVRVVGIDDVEYAGLLPVPLTTLRQPAREIGAAAMAVMLDRVAHPDRPLRDVLLHGTLVVRESCGARKRGEPPVASVGAAPDPIA